MIKYTDIQICKSRTPQGDQHQVDDQLKESSKSWRNDHQLHAKPIITNDKMEEAKLDQKEKVWRKLLKEKL